MTSEVSVTDQTADGHVEEKKGCNDIKNIHEESVSQPKEIEGIDEEEKLKAEELTISEAIVIEPDETLEDKKGDNVVEEVKREEEDCKVSGSDVLAGDSSKEVESSEQESDISTALEPVVEVEEKEPKNQTDISDIPEPPCEAKERPVKDLDSSSVQEPQSEAAKELEVSEPPNEEAEGAELAEISVASTSASETGDKPEESPIVSTAMVASDVIGIVKGKIETPNANEPAEISRDVKILAEEVETSPKPSKEELSLNGSSDLVTVCKLENAIVTVQETTASDSLVMIADAAEGNVLKEVGGTFVHKVSDVPEITDVDPNSNGNLEEPKKEESGSAEIEELVKEAPVDASFPNASTSIGLIEATDTSYVTETAENFVRPEVVLEEKKQEKTLEIEEPTLSKTTKIAAAAAVCEVASEVEKPFAGVEMIVEKDGIVEGDKTTSVETPKDLDVEERKNDIDTSANEPMGNFEEAELVLKPAESISPVLDNLENEDSEDKKEETEKADGQNLIEPSKDGGDTKTDGENPKQEVGEVASEVEKPSAGVEMIIKKKDEIVEGDKTTSVEIPKDLDVEERKNDTYLSANEPMDMKPDESIPPALDKLENEDSEDKKEETEKAEDQNLIELFKDGRDTKTDGDNPKQEVPAKPSQRQSNNIISKVKKSIVKVKKAIIGKSPSSKTIASEGKGEINVK